MKSALFKITKGVLFTVILFTMIIKIGPWFRTDTMDANVWRNYYDLKEDTLDVVSFGSSALFRYWIPAQAYEEQGITSTIIYCGGQDIDMVPYLMEEAFKTQHPELIVVETRRLIQEMLKRQKKGDAFDQKKLDYLTSTLLTSMHLNANKFGIVHNVMQVSLEQELEYMLPLLKYHENIYNYSLRDFQIRDNRDMIRVMTGLPISKVASRKLTLVDEKDFPELDMPEDVFDILDRIVEVADKHGSEVLFIATPYCVKPDGQAMRKAMDDYMDEKGYHYLDMIPVAIDEIGLDFSTDLYNINHTNLAGATKVTKYMGDFISETFDFQSSLSEEDKAYWDTYVERYHERMKERWKLWKKQAKKVKAAQQEKGEE